MTATMESRVSVNKSFEGRCFIIPNSIGTYKSWSSDSSRENRQKCYDIFKEQGFELRPFEEEMFVQIWWVVDSTGDGHDCENLCAHGCHVDIDETTGAIFQPKTSLLEYVPASIFDNLKEGDTISFDWTEEDCWTITKKGKGDYDVNSPKEATPVDVTAHMEMKLAQTETRYARFGSFEEVLANLMAHPSREWED